MPKKRNYEDLIENYRSKIRRLEDQRRKRRRILIESSDSGEESSQDELSTPTHEVEGSAAAHSEPHVNVTTPSSAQENNATAPQDVDPELDPEVLLALGEPTNCTPKFGEKIHQSLAQRWDSILKKGLIKEDKEKLLKQYLVPENCTLLQAPKLNEEVSAAISEAARQRDKRKELDQQQLGVGISAINNALTLSLTSTAGNDKKLEAIKIFSDGCRILADLHFGLTHSRKSVINYSLAKPFLNIIDTQERDDTLYGQKLAEKIKASKAIEKQGLSIKKTTKTQQTKTNEQTPSSSRPHQSNTSYRGNWSGPSRFQQNRGGRRGPARTYTPSTNNRRLPSNQLQQPQSNVTGPTRMSRTPVTRN